AQQGKKGEWEWKPITPRSLDEKITNTDFGVLLNGQDYQHPYLRDIAEVIWEQPFTRTWIEKYGTTQANRLVSLVIKNKQILYMHPGMWHLDIDSELRSMSSRQGIEDYIVKLANDYMSYAKPAHNATGKPVYINFANEPWWADPPNNPVNVGWLKNPYYNYLGKNYLIEGYIAFYQAGLQQGLTPGVDFRLILSVDGIFFPNKKLTLAISEIQRMRNVISRRLGIPEESVQLDIALQWRFDPTTTGGQTSSEGRYRMPTESELERALQTIYNAGIPFHITEFEIANIKDDEFNLTINEFCKIAVEYGARSITIGGISHTESNPFKDMRHPVFENGRFTSTYYAYIKLMLDILNIE
ncbi:MAG: hypothetical protein ACPLF9_08895, partial [Methanothermobacter tenebrarum]